MRSPFQQWTKTRLGLIPVFFLSLFSGSYAQDQIIDPVSIAMGGCYTTADISAGIYNEASFGISNKRKIHLSHTRPFVIKELGITSLAAKFHLFPGKMQIGIMHYGIPGFQQVNASIGYGLKLAEKIYAGIGFRYYNTSSLGEWSYLRTLGISGGVLIKADEKTLLAAHIVNPVTINNYEEYGSVFPSMISVGVKREVYESTNVYSECMYCSSSKLHVRFAADYRCSSPVILRAGYHSNPNSISFGSRLNFKGIIMDMAFSYSMRIGVTPALSITYTPGK